MQSTPGESSTLLDNERWAGQLKFPSMVSSLPKSNCCKPVLLVENGFTQNTEAGGAWRTAQKLHLLRMAALLSYIWSSSKLRVWIYAHSKPFCRGAVLLHLSSWSPEVYSARCNDLTGGWGEEAQQLTLIIGTLFGNLLELTLAWKANNLQ